MLSSLLASARPFTWQKSQAPSIKSQTNDKYKATMFQTPDGPTGACGSTPEKKQAADGGDPLGMDRHEVQVQWQLGQASRSASVPWCRRCFHAL